MLTQIDSDSYVIKSVKLVENNQPSPTLYDVWVENGILQAIANSQDPHSFNTDYQIDGKGCLLIPAGVDPQVHLRVPGQSHKETADHGAAAAIRGGIAAVLTMPNTDPVIDNEEAINLAREELDRVEKIKGFHADLAAAITKGQRGQEVVDFDQLAQLGVLAFTDDGVGVVDSLLMKEALAASERLGLPILQHAEFMGHGGILAEGPVQKNLGIKPYPRQAEIDMVVRDLDLLASYPKARYHVLHISCRETIDLVQNAKAKGLHASCEVTPHHLYFCSHDIDPHNTAFKMNPPLRDPEDRVALQQALVAGKIDFVATDHAPHEAEAKSSGFKTAAFGTTGLETSIRVLTDLYQKGVLPLARLVEVFSKKPAEFLGINDRYGQLKTGHAFYATLINLDAAATPVTEAQLESLSKNNCFLNTPLPDPVMATFLTKHCFKIQ